MLGKALLCLCLILLPALPAVAEKEQTQPKELSGMSILGNDEVPKSLYIVPWKSSEIGVGTSLGMMLDESPVPVDREVFMRQITFYEVSTEESVSRPVPGLSEVVAGAGF